MQVEERRVDQMEDSRQVGAEPVPEAGPHHLHVHGHGFPALDYLDYPHHVWRYVQVDQILAVLAVGREGPWR